VSHSSDFCRQNPFCCFSTSFIVIVVVVVYFVIDLVRKLLDTLSYISSSTAQALNNCPFLPGVDVWFKVEDVVSSGRFSIKFGGFNTGPFPMIGTSRRTQVLSDSMSIVNWLESHRLLK
jgi:hypothetical protein